MIMLISLGLCISAYYIYQNKEKVLINIARAGIKLEDIYLNYKGISVSYLVQDHINYNLINKYNKYYLDMYVSNLSYKDKENNYFVILKYNIKRKTLCYVKNSLTFNDIIIYEKDLNFSSPIILCQLSIFEIYKNKELKLLFNNIEITECFNYLINRNSRIILSNKSKYKQFWIYYLNHFLNNRNIRINCNNLSNIKLCWKIMDYTGKTFENEEILIDTKRGTTNIKIIDPETDSKIFMNENDNDNDNDNELVEDELVEDEIVESELVEDELVESELVEDEIVESELVESELVEDEIVENELVEDELVENELVDTIQMCEFSLD